MLLWPFLVLILAGFGFSVWIILLSLGPRPGDKMKLMGLVIVAPPMLACAAAAAALAVASKPPLNGPERTIVWTIIGLAGVVMGALVVVG